MRFSLVSPFDRLRVSGAIALVVSLIPLVVSLPNHAPFDRLRVSGALALSLIPAHGELVEP